MKLSTRVRLMVPAVACAIVVAGAVALAAAAAPQGAGPGAPTTPSTAPAPPAQKEDPVEKEKHIRRLLKVTGAADMGIQVMGQVLAQLKKTYPDVPADFWDDIDSEFSPDSLVDLCVPIYARHFSDADIQALTEFYESPVGQRVLKEMPAAMNEAMAAGRSWGLELARKAAQKLRDAGYGAGH